MSYWGIGVDASPFTEIVFKDPQFQEHVNNLFHGTIEDEQTHQSIEELYMANGDTHDNSLTPDELNLMSIIYSGVDPFSAVKESSEIENITKENKDKKEIFPCGLQSYHNSIAKYPPMNRKEEELTFIKLKKSKAHIRSSFLKLPEEKKKLFLSLNSAFFKNFGVIQSEIKRLNNPHRNSLENALNEYLEIRNFIVTRNLRFVVKISKSFWKDQNVETFKNLISAGNIGLMEAVDNFDVKRGTRFLSYAAHWIALQIRLETADRHLVKIPLWWQKMVRKMANAYKENMGVPMTTKQLSNKTNIPEFYILQINNNLKVVNEDNLTVTPIHYEYTDREIASSREDHEDLVSRKDIREKLQEFITILPTKEQGVIRLLFGLSMDNHSYNLREIGNIYNLSAERVRQLKEKALDTLRENFKRIGYVNSDDIYTRY